MKTLANFGEFVFDHVWYFSVVFVLSFGLIYQTVKVPTVTLDKKHWECGNPVPDGIEARCTSYHFRGK